LQVQMAQERYRDVHAGYGSLSDLRIAARSAAGHYRLAMTDRSESAYEVQAIAYGGQQADADCRYLRLSVAGAGIVQASGRDARFSNGDTFNRRCWGQ